MIGVVYRIWLMSDASRGDLRQPATTPCSCAAVQHDLFAFAIRAKDDGTGREEVFLFGEEGIGMMMMDDFSTFLIISSSRKKCFSFSFWGSKGYGDNSKTSRDILHEEGNPILEKRLSVFRINACWSPKGGRKQAHERKSVSKSVGHRPPRHSSLSLRPCCLYCPVENEKGVL